jgi:hypothetical protein
MIDEKTKTMILADLIAVLDALTGEPAKFGMPKLPK